MKELVYITALTLSLLIIYSGGGAFTVHYCCVRCETIQSCYDAGCLECKKTHTCDPKKGCKDKGCTAIIYKLDLMRHITELAISALVVNLLCEHFCYLLTPTYTNKPIEYDNSTSPPPFCSRQELVLYSAYIV